MTHHERRDWLTRKFIYGSLSFLTVVLLVVAFWLLAPYRTIEFKNEAGTPVYVTNKTVYRQNENGSYTVKFCKYTDMKPTVTKKFEDGIEYTADDTRAVLDKGCHTQSVSLHIPETLPPGRYRLAIYLDYQVNPLRDIAMEHYSNWFTVTRDETGAYGNASNGGVCPTQ
jgi:hypothetical protein